MRVRLAGIPAAYTLATDVMVVDEDDNLYLIGCEEPAVTPLDDSDTMLIMGFYEPVQSVTVGQLPWGVVVSPN